MIISLTHEGRSFPSISVEEARAAGIPEATIEAGIQSAEATERRATIRSALRAGPGDTASLLGTTSDGSSLLLVEIGRMARALSQATTLAEMRDAATPFAELIGPFLDDIDSGEISLPYLAKGTAEDVLRETGERGTAVSQAIIDANGP